MPRAKSAAFDKELIRELANLLDETGLGEIEIEQEGFKVRVARPFGTSHMVPAAPSSTDLAIPPPPAPEAKKPADATSHPGVVTSPMVGTAYRAPGPGAAPFVETGSEVRQGQIVLIIEAMKTMNQIPAPRDGRVTEILIADGQPVEYGEPLLIIE